MPGISHVITAMEYGELLHDEQHRRDERPDCQCDDENGFHCVQRPNSPIKIGIIK